MTVESFKICAVLRDNTPFNHIFPGRHVPVKSALPIMPREVGTPWCYLIPGNLLTDEQVRELAKMLFNTWKPECESIEQAISYIQNDALPLRCDWFESVIINDEQEWNLVIEPGWAFVELENPMIDELCREE